MVETEAYLMRQKIAYFSMEIGLSNNIHTYNGGLGILAGDTIRSSADLQAGKLKSNCEKLKEHTSSVMH